MYYFSRNYQFPLQPALNVHHDANHGSISRYPAVNRVLGLIQNWIGGSQVYWIHSHVVQHHIHTNDIHLDPDTYCSTYLRYVVRYWNHWNFCLLYRFITMITTSRTNPLDRLVNHQLAQIINFWLLLPLYSSWIFWKSISKYRMKRR